MKANKDISPSNQEEGKALAKFLLKAALSVCKKYEIDIGEVIHSSVKLSRREIFEEILELWNAHRDQTDLAPSCSRSVGVTE